MDVINEVVTKPTDWMPIVQSILSIVSVLSGALIGYWLNKKNTILNAKLQDSGKKRDKKVEKLEELHNLLMQLDFKLYARHYNAIDMIKKGAMPDDIHRELQATGQGFHETTVLQSTINSLSAIYTQELETDSKKKAANFILLFEEFGNKHENGQATITDLETLSSKLDDFIKESNRHRDNVRDLILKISNEPLISKINKDSL